MKLCQLIRSPGGCQYGSKCYDRHRNFYATNSHKEEEKEEEKQLEVYDDEQEEDEEEEADQDGDEDEDGDDDQEHKEQDQDWLAIDDKDESPETRKDEKEEEAASNSKHLIDSAFNKIDSGLAAYYAICRRSDYFNEDGKGKFILFAEQNKLSEEDINLELGDSVNPDDCLFIDIDDDFPLKKEYHSGNDRKTAVFKVR